MEVLEILWEANLNCHSKTDDLVSATHGNTIEAIENNKNKFYIGLQWHPENLYNIDINSQKIFDYFIKICKN